MLAAWIVVDGNNLLHVTPRKNRGPESADAQRRALIRRLDRLVGEAAERVTVVFDGRLASREPGGPGMEVVFTGRDESADGVIERMASLSSRPERMLVVTSDRLETQVAQSAGAQTMGCRAFLDCLEDCEKRLGEGLSARRKAGAGRATIGDVWGGRKAGGE